MKKILFLLTLLLCVAQTFAAAATYKLSWDKVAGAARYQVQVATDKSFATTLKEEVTVHTEAMLDMDLPEPQFFWRVRAINESGTEGPWSDIKEFTKKNYELQQAALAVKNADSPLTPLLYGKGEDVKEIYSLPSGKSLILRFEAQDDRTSNPVIYAKVNDQPFALIPDKTIRLQEDGLFVITWYAVDEVGNKSETKLRKILIDSVPPHVSYSVDGSNYLTNGAVTKNGRLKITAVDSLIGIKSIRYKKATESEWKEVSGPVNLTEVGSQEPVTLEITAEDKAGNIAPVQNFKFFIKDNPPVLPPLLGSSATSQTSELKRVPKEGLTVPAYEEGSVMEVRINDSDYAPVQPGEVIRFSEDGNHTVHQKITDQLGNTQETSFKVLVDTIPPKTEITPVLNP